jgi:large subunit ribosomal protein L13
MHAATSAPAFKGDLLNKSYYPTSADASNVNKRWYVIDAEGQTLGRLASLAATYIRCGGAASSAWGGSSGR